MSIRHMLWAAVTVTATAAGLAAAGLATGTVATARPATPVAARAQPVPMAAFAITVRDLPYSTSRRWTLICGPDGGTHPNPKEACDRLRAINGDLEQIRFRDVSCPRFYDPRR